jgi:hypothetical protein
VSGRNKRDIRKEEGDEREKEGAVIRGELHAHTC